MLLSDKVNKTLPLDIRVRPGEDLQTWLLRALWCAYYDARHCKRFTQDEARFELNELENILILRDSILERRYKPGRGVAFIVYDPVMREIFAAPFRDRVVHHLACSIVGEWWDRRLIYDSYSCRKGKGTLVGAQRLAHHIQSATNNYQNMNWYVVKLDIQGYFMSLPRDLLYERIMWGLRRQFDGKLGEIGNLAAYLWQQVIFDDPTLHVEKRGDWSEWRKLPRNKSLFQQEPRTGMAIGNYSSQMLSNIFLDQLDRFVVFDLGYKHYGRYVDDFFILVPGEEVGEFMREKVPMIERFLAGKGLVLHPNKRYCQPVEKGVTFVGIKVRPGRLLPGQRVVKRFRQVAYEVAAGEDDMEKIVTYMGHISHLRWRRATARVFESVGWELEVFGR